MNERLQSALRKLRLSGLQVRLKEAAANRLTHAEFLDLILQDELAVRGERLIARRTKAAALRELKTLVAKATRVGPKIRRDSQKTCLSVFLADTRWIEEMRREG